VKRVAVIIPCYNEEAGIANVIAAFPRQALAHAYTIDVIVIDNNSSDQTAAVAKAAGAKVVFEPKQGKGHAIKAGFGQVGDADYVVMLDGDTTYRPEEIGRLLEPLHSGFCNVVIGSRLGGRIGAGSMRQLNRAGNWLYSHLVRYSYRVNVTDVLTGYFAWKREVVQELRPHLTSPGFAIEMEMITKMARLGHEIYSVPISYTNRAGHSSLSPLRDGMRILAMYARNIRWQPELALVPEAVPATPETVDMEFGERIEYAGTVDK
jgi:glycosyltransferase involved in cell wall biosynthesis